MIKLDADIPTTTHGFFQLSIELLGLTSLSRIYKRGHSALYKYARDPDRFPEGEVRQNPLKRLCIHCHDMVALGGARGRASVRVVAAMIADLVDCDVAPRQAVCPDKADIKSECLDDYPPLVKLHNLIEIHAPNGAVREQMRQIIQEVMETVAAYEHGQGEMERER